MLCDVAVCTFSFNGASSTLVTLHSSVFAECSAYSSSQFYLADDPALLHRKAIGSLTYIRGDEPICYRGPHCQLPLSKRAAKLFSHTTKPAKNETKKPVQESSRLLVSPECFAGRMFVTPDTHATFCTDGWHLLSTKQQFKYLYRI